MTASAAKPLNEPRSTRLIAMVDGAAIAWTAAFVIWLFVAGRWPAYATAIDLAFFIPLGIGGFLLMVRAGLAARAPRDRWAWYALAAAIATRLTAGSIWRLITAAGLHPPSSTWLSLVRCALELGAVLLFASARFQRSDRIRYLLDAATVAIGVALIEWFLAVRVISEPTAAGTKLLSDYAVFLTSAVGAMLSALLYLRRTDSSTRHAAVCLMLAFSMQTYADALQWNGPIYESGSAVTAWWWAIWLLRLTAARVALGARSADEADVRTYNGHAMPYVFLAGANVTLWMGMSYPLFSNEWLVLATSVLTASIVIRHIVEQRDQVVMTRELAAEKARFGALVEHSYDAVVLVVGDGGALYVSPTTRRLVGDDPAFGAPWGLLTALHPDDAPKLKKALTQSGNASQLMTCRVRSAEGEYHMFAIRIVDLRLDPRVGAIALHGHDITREMQLARRLHETAEVEALGVFAGGLAHDLNNVLGAISNHVDLLLLDVPEQSGAALELHAIERAVSRGVRLTRALLGLSRRKATALEVVDLGDFLAVHAPATSQVDVPADIVRVRMDQTSLAYALDAVLDEDAPLGRRFSRWRLSVTRRDLPGSEATAVDLAAGAYAVLHCDTGRPDAGFERRTSVEGAAIDEGLDVLLARAVLREMGGTLVVHAGMPPSRHLTFFLPAEVA